MFDVKPTWCSRPSSSYRPSSSEPTTLLLRRVAKAADDALGGAHAASSSACRRASPLWYGRSSRLAMTPSRPPPTERSQRFDRRQRRSWPARGERRAPSRHVLARERLERARGAPAAAASTSDLPAASTSRSNTMSVAGRLARRACSTRLSAGWMRSSSSSNDSAAVDRDRRSRRRARSASAVTCEHRRDDLGEVAGERLARLRLQLDFVAVAKREAAKAVPLGLVLPPGAGRDLVHDARLHRRDSVRVSGSITARAASGKRPRCGQQRLPQVAELRRRAPARCRCGSPRSRCPRSTSSQVTGVDTGAPRLAARTE